MRSSLIFSVSVAVGILATGCSNGGVPESTVRGTAALSTFQSAPSTIAARDEAGRVTRGLVDAHGAFAVPLVKGHTYRLAFEGAGGSVPIVFPRASGSLDTSFVLKTDGASLPLGQVRHFDIAPPGGFHVRSIHAPANTPPPSTGPAGADCVDCVNDDQQVTCGGSESEGTESMPSKDSAEPASASAEMAVGEENVPEEVDGCDNNNVEQQGEH